MPRTYCRHHDCSHRPDQGLKDQQRSKAARPNSEPTNYISVKEGPIRRNPASDGSRDVAPRISHKKLGGRIEHEKQEFSAYDYQTEPAPLGR